MDSSSTSSPAAELTALAENNNNNNREVALSPTTALPRPAEDDVAFSVTAGLAKEAALLVQSGVDSEEDLPTMVKKNIRTLVCCIIGDVGTGKTKLIDCIAGEAGVCVQQIGATFISDETIRARIGDTKLNVPGLFFLDTPAGKSIIGSWSRSLDCCDIAILVVDIMLGLQPDEIALLKLLKMRNTKFLIAVNKIDKLNGWSNSSNLKQQSSTFQSVLSCRLNKIIGQFKEQELDANNAMWETLNIVATCAISGQGIGNLLQLLVQLVQKTMVDTQSNQNKVQCTVLEVKVVEGHGTVIDVVLANGVLREGDQIVICGMKVPIVTNIRALLTPHSMNEHEVKGTYKFHKEIKAPQVMKIAAQGLEPAVAGTQLFVVGTDDDLEYIKEAVEEDMRPVRNIIASEGTVYIQAATIGSLEALIESLKSLSLNFPVSGIGIGPVRERDVLEASSLVKKSGCAIILALDARVISEARDLANKLGVKIFCSAFIDPLVYRLQSFMNSQKRQVPKEDAKYVVFPCILVPKCFSNDKDKKDTCLVVVNVLEGIAKIGTPLCIKKGPSFISVGEIASIEVDHKPVDHAKKGEKAVIEISNDVMPENFVHLEIDNELLSFITSRSIKAVKEHCKDALSSDDWRLMFKLKNFFWDQEPEPDPDWEWDPDLDP